MLWEHAVQFKSSISDSLQFKNIKKSQLNYININNIIKLIQQLFYKIKNKINLYKNKKVILTKKIENNIYKVNLNLYKDITYINTIKIKEPKDKSINYINYNNNLYNKILSSNFLNFLI